MSELVTEPEFQMSPTLSKYEKLLEVTMKFLEVKIEFETFGNKGSKDFFEENKKILEQTECEVRDDQFTCIIIGELVKFYGSERLLSICKNMINESNHEYLTEIIQECL